MNTSVNQVHLVGSLTQMPAVMTNSNGDKMARFAISTKEYRPGIEGKIETQNQWHKLIARNKWAMILEEFAEKGQQIAIEGRLCSRFFKSKDGKNHCISEIEVQDLVLLGKSVQKLA